MRQPGGEEAAQIRRPNLLSSYPASRLFSASESSELGQKSDPCLQIGSMGLGGDGWEGSTVVGGEQHCCWWVAIGIHWCSLACGQAKATLNTS